jgi:acetylornithine deacetylase/succinyl-diaminopimelate desuccinylase-like protein
MSDLTDVFAHIDAHRDDYIAMLQAMIRQPSVAAQNHGMTEMAAMVESHLSGLGFEAKQYPTGGFPVVYAERAGRSPKRLSFYNHYDVQPADPVELWDSDPWSGDVRDGRIWGRGVADNKGNLAARIAAIEAIQQVRGELPLTVKFIVEGEEEISSVHIEDFTHAHPDLVAADGCIWEFGGKDYAGRQILHLGLKGICYVELRARGANGDQHSSIASSVPNPAWRLAWALGTLKGPDERVLIPGFYDKVVPPTEADLAALEAIPDDSEQQLERLGIEHFLLDEQGLDRKVRDYFLPTCTISGLLSGYTGEGSKTVLPSTAMAKIDMRLVMDQDPQEIYQLLRKHLDEQGFSDIEVVMLGSEPPGKAPLDSPLATIVADTYKELTGADSVLTPTSQGSGPWYQLCTAFGIDACTQGAGHPATNAHAPNENIFVDDFITSIKQVVMILDRFAAS